MNLAVVAMSRPNPAFLTSREEKKMLGGVAVADLRRMVIDKMVSSGGWVVNDFVREVNGQSRFRGHRAHAERCSDSGKDVDVLFHGSRRPHLRADHRFTS